MFNLKFKNLPYGILFVLILVGVVYSLTLHGFFQHDEWTTFATYFTDHTPWNLKVLSFFKPNVAHYAPFQELAYYGIFSIFGLNYQAYAVISIFLQLITVYLVYVLCIRLFERKDIAVVGALLFGLNASGHQATSWMATTINTHGATIFAIISVLFLSESIKKSKNSRYFPILSVVSLFISLLFKEITIGIFAVLVIVILMFSKKTKRVNRKFIYYTIFISLAIYILFRAPMFFSNKGDIEERLVTESQSLQEVGTNLFTFPAKIFSQAIVPTRYLLSISKQITFLLPDKLSGLPGTTAFDIFSQQVILQILNWSIFLSFATVIYKLHRGKHESLFKIALFGFLFCVINSFVYALSPGRGGSIPVVDSRNIYFPSIGAMISLVALIFILVQRTRRKAYLLLIFLLMLNFFGLKEELSISAEVGSERIEILKEIKKNYPNLPNKVIVYAKSDKSYYGLPEETHILPFQINFGYTLLVWYLPENKYDHKFVKLGGYLYGISNQGYKEISGKGFGYYYNFEQMKKDLEVYGLSSDSVIAFEYDSRKKLLYDVTQRIRKEIDSD